MYVARHSNIDEEHRPVLALAENRFSMLATEQRLRCTRGSEHNVRAPHGLLETLERNGLTVERFGQFHSTLVRAIADQNRLSAVSYQMPCRQLGHFSGAH